MKKLKSVCSSIEKRIKINKTVIMEVEIIYTATSRFNGQYLGNSRFVLWIPGKGITKWNMNSLVSIILHELGHWDSDWKGLDLDIYTEEEKYADNFAKRYLAAGEKFTLPKSIKCF